MGARCNGTGAKRITHTEYVQLQYCNNPVVAPFKSNNANFLGNETISNNLN